MALLANLVILLAKISNFLNFRHKKTYDLVLDSHQHERFESRFVPSICIKMIMDLLYNIKYFTYLIHVIGLFQVRLLCHMED